LVSATDAQVPSDGNFHTQKISPKEDRAGNVEKEAIAATKTFMGIKLTGGVKQ